MMTKFRDYFQRHPFPRFIDLAEWAPRIDEGGGEVVAHAPRGRGEIPMQEGGDLGSSSNRVLAGG